MGKKRIVSVIIVLLMILSSFSVNAAVNSDGNQPSQSDNPTETTVFAGGSGTEDDPYLIENAEQLSEISNNLSANYKLTSDIDMTGVAYTPIGKYGIGEGEENNKPFSGVLDGDNHVIRNLTLKTSKTNTKSYVGGLFAYVNEATVKNLQLDNIDFDITVLKNGNAIVLGSIAASSTKSSFDSITVKGKIYSNSSNSSVGGICGNARTSVNCNNLQVDVDMISKGKAVTSGIIGYGFGERSESFQFVNCHNKGDITSNNASGLVRVSDFYTVNVDDSSNTGNLTASDTYEESVCSGLVTNSDGYLSGHIINSYNTGTVIGCTSTAGLANKIDDGFVVENSYNTGNITSYQPDRNLAYYQTHTSGLINECSNGNGDQNDSPVISNCYNTGTIKGRYAAGIITELSYGSLERCYNSGLVSSNSSFKGISGGIVTTNSSEISNCYNIGAINNTISGGIAGENKSFSVIDKCYNTGAVSATNLGAAICGVNDSTVGDNYYFDGTTQSVAKAGSGSTNDSVSLSNGQLTNQESYPALDFGTKDTLSKKTAKAAGIWEMSEYSKMPKLTGMKEVYVKSIALSSYPKTYTVNKSIPKSKVKIKVTYSNGKKATINAGFKFKTYSKKIGKRKITVYYAGKSLSFYTTFVPAQVSKVVLKPGKKKVTIKIKKAAGAKKYQIYRSTKSKKGYKLIKTVASTKYVNKKLKSKKIYYFKVRAINGKYKGPFSKIYKVKIK